MSNIQILNSNPQIPECEMPNSLWVNTAIPLEISLLQENVDCDILIIGGGYTGLSSALSLSERGYNTILVDAAEPGYGASGRNGGQVIPGLKMYPDEVIQRYGSELGDKIIRSTNSSADLVFDLIEKHQIDCFATRKGFLQPAFSLPSCRVIEKRAKSLSSYGAPVEMIDRTTTCEYLGTDVYHAALLDRRGGSIQPLRYARGLARAARNNGARIFSYSPVNSINRIQDHWVSRTPKGIIKSELVLICTNGYTDLAGENSLWNGLGSSIIPLYSFQIATRPLASSLLETILPYGHVASDTRRLLSYFRLDHTNRLVMGGRGGIQDARNSSDYGHIVKRLHTIYPRLKGQIIEFFWSGKVALTLDGVPHIHELAPGIYTGLGYNGRGVGMATLMGTWLAQIATSKNTSKEYIPFTPLKKIKLSKFRKPAISIAYVWKSLQDRIEASRRIPNRE